MALLRGSVGTPSISPVFERRPPGCIMGVWLRGNRTWGENHGLAVQVRRYGFWLGLVSKLWCTGMAQAAGVMCRAIRAH